MLHDFALLVTLVAHGVQAHPLPKTVEKRTLVRRALLISDATLTTIPEVRVAAGVPTTLAFRQPLNEKLITLADVTDSFLPVRSTARTVQLIPKTELAAGTLTTLTLSLADGTVLPFLLTSATRDVDVQIDIDVKLDKEAPSESSQALRILTEQLRSRLEDCVAGSDSVGVSKVAAFIVKEDPDKPQVLESHAIHALDKQSRLLVEVKRAYRLFGHTYVVLTVENRDSSKAWVFDRTEISLTGDETTELKVSSSSTDTPSIGPDEVLKLVIAFVTPPQTAKQHFAVALFEKNGSRHVRLENLGL